MSLRRTRAPRFLQASLLLGAITASVLVATQGPANAASNLSELVDHTYQANGRVAAILPVGNTLYLAGSFTSLRPYGDPAGTGEVARSYLAAVDRDTGQLLPWNPGANKEAYSLAASPDGSVIYVGGLFTKVAGAERDKAAAVTASTGTLTSWAPAADNKVLAIAVTSTRVYLGGTFTEVDGVPRASLAAVDTGAGTLDAAWHPAADDRVMALHTSTDGQTVYAGGDFVSINGDASQKHFASLAASTGALQPWAFHPGYPIEAITISGSSLYAGGDGAGGHVAAYTLPSGSRVWDDQTDGGVQAVNLIGDTLYVGGHFDNFCSTDTTGGTTGFECPIILAVRHKILAVDAATGSLDPWNPGADSPLGVYAVATSAGRLEIGGDFAKAGHFHNQQGYAQFSQSGTPILATGDGFSPVAPTRILDTRTGLGVSGGVRAKLGAGKTLLLHVGGVAGVPLGIDAVVLNVTAISPTTATFITAYPADLAVRPTASNINVAARRVVANLVTVKVDAAGSLDLYNSAGSVDLAADVSGYYSASATSSYTPLTPVRILDTRAGLGAPKAQVDASGTIDLQVTGSGGVPSTATAVVMNVTATGATASTYVQAYPVPTGTGAAPVVSNLNVPAGRVVANLVTVQIGAGGKVRLGNNAGSVDLLADVAGYFSTSASGSRYTPISPIRLLDTRTGTGEAAGQTGSVGPGGLIDLQVTGGTVGVPVDATAVVFNYTAVRPSAGTFVQAYPAPSGGFAFPTVSSLNPVSGDVLANLVSVTVGAGGRVRLRNQAGAVDLVADLAGYYASVAGVAHGTAPSAPGVAGVTVTATPTPLLPPQGTAVAVHVSTVAGAVVAGVATFTSGQVTDTATADSSGTAALSFDVGTAPVGVVVPVTVTAVSATLGAQAATTTTFTPAP